MESKPLNTNTPHLPAASTPEFVKATPTWVQDIIRKAADKYNIPSMILSGVVKTESGFDPHAKSASGGIGVAGWIPETAQKLGVNPLDPTSAIDGMAAYLKHALDKFGDIKLAIAAYNSGEKTVVQFKNQVPPFQETQNYVKNVMDQVSEPHASAHSKVLDMINQYKKASEPSMPSKPSGGNS